MRADSDAPIPRITTPATCTGKLVYQTARLLSSTWPAGTAAATILASVYWAAWLPRRVLHGFTRQDFLLLGGSAETEQRGGHNGTHTFGGWWRHKRIAFCAIWQEWKRACQRVALHFDRPTLGGYAAEQLREHFIEKR
ncbi:unnamed protein product [Heligmosomoides polygyrus]|uniref:DUF1294 domain-containing protein n=1 Tax=Heligmosomoides polygyrus TaxID=6339 RepID=A0A183GQN3_HELPZ|nr:unnamed protein product [Heligmosomoides polygyrus]